MSRTGFVPAPRRSVRRKFTSQEHIERAVALKRQGQDYPVIAKALGCSHGTAYNLVRRGLDQYIEAAKAEAGKLLDLERSRLETDRAVTFDVEAKLRATIATTEKHLTWKRPVRRTKRGKMVVVGHVVMINTRAVEQHREALNALGRLVETRIKISDRLGRLLGLDRAKAEKSDDPSAMAPYMQVLVGIWQERDGTATVVGSAVVTRDSASVTSGNGSGGNGAGRTLAP